MRMGSEEREAAALLAMGEQFLELGQTDEAMQALTDGD